MSYWRIGVLLVLGCTAFSISDQLPGGACQATEIANLQDQLENGLRAKLPNQKAFIASVVEAVESGQLPLRTVYALFKWARPKQPHPFPYFEESVRRAAAKVGVNL